MNIMGKINHILKYIKRDTWIYCCAKTICHSGSWKYRLIEHMVLQHAKYVCENYNMA